MYLKTFLSFLKFQILVCCGNSTSLFPNSTWNSQKSITRSLQKLQISAANFCEFADVIMKKFIKKFINGSFWMMNHWCVRSSCHLSQPRKVDFVEAFDAGAMCLVRTVREVQAGAIHTCERRRIIRQRIIKRRKTFSSGKHLLLGWIGKTRD